MTADEARLAELLRLSFHHAPAREANAQIAAIRQQIEGLQGQAVNYEVNLFGRDHRYLESTVAPRLALYLKSKRMAVKHCAPVFLSVFFGETLYFIGAPEFFAFIQKRMGLDDEAFSARAEVWQRTGKGVVGLLP